VNDASVNVCNNNEFIHENLKCIKSTCSSITWDFEISTNRNCENCEFQPI
jgi:hypothetical protein